MHRSPIVEQHSPFPFASMDLGSFAPQQQSAPISYAPYAHQMAPAPTTFRPAVPVATSIRASLPQIDKNTFQLPPGARRIGWQAYNHPVQAFRTNATAVHTTLTGSMAMPYAPSALPPLLPHPNLSGSKRQPVIIRPGSLPGTALPAHLAGVAPMMKAESLASVVTLEQVERKPCASPNPGPNA